MNAGPALDGNGNSSQALLGNVTNVSLEAAKENGIQFYQYF
jgi:hypothetical protein